MNANVGALGGRERIGDALQAVNAELAYCGRRLQALLFGRIADAAEAPLREMMDELHNQVCRVAVVGQIKAGKSSFVNALAERPDLLPTHVNPWTSAVTRLHFGKPNGPEAGAHFNFFSEEEWRSLADGSERMRHLTERLIPGFRHDLLRRQFDAMRETTEVRLGKQFRHLLGKSHEFPEITPEILERYICGGSPFSEDLRGPVTGRFADVTKTADLFFPLAPFAHPAVMIDTPGTNDPFLVRDEITRRSLEEADVSVVVLTARQPLSPSDLQLLRILHGLNKDRIVAFVNRIDELDDPIGDALDVMKRVERTLGKEFPKATIPVVAGSALWGQAAFAADMDPARTFTPGLAACARAHGLIEDEEIAAWAKGEAIDPERIRRLLQHCSGLPEATKRISELILRGPGAAYVRSVADCMGAVAEMVQSHARQELAFLSPKHQSESEKVDKLDRARRDLERMGAIVMRIEHLVKKAEQDLRTARDQSLETMREALDHDVLDFADKEAAALQATLLDRPSERVWRCQTHELRRTLEKTFLDHYGDARDWIADIHGDAAAKLRAALQESGPSEDAEEDSALLQISDPRPSLAPLGASVSLDLDMRLWSMWWRRKRTPEERAEEVRRLIRNDFDDVVEALIQSARREMMTHSRDSAQRFMSLSLELTRRVQERRLMLKEALSGGRGGEPSKADPDAAKQKAERAALYRDSLAGSREVLKRLRNLAKETAAPAKPALKPSNGRA